MNWTQFQRWKGFSLRMVRRGYQKITDVRREKIEHQLMLWFDEIMSSTKSSFWCRQQLWKAIIDWDNTENDRNYVCDMVYEFFDEFLSRKQRPDGTYDTKFFNQITCCIRAGLDCATAPSGGVIGFTVRDLRRMYLEGIPEWILSEYEGLEKAKDDDGIWL